MVSLIAERGAQPLHGGVQAVLEIDEGAVGPQARTELLAGHDVPGPLQHQPQDLEWLLLEPDAGLSLPQLT